MKKLSLLLAVAFAAPAFAQTTTPATDAASTTTSYPPCSAQVTDQCKETPWTHGHHAHAPAHHKGHHPKK